MRKFVILGSKGTIGNALVEELTKRKIPVLGITREHFDATSSESIEKLASENPDAIYVNCIAFMPADKCETEIEASKEINLKFVDRITKTLSRLPDTRFIQLSTDFIFDGKTESPYETNAASNPLNQYGKHKALAESSAQHNLRDRAQIVRFASLVAQTGKGNTFIEKISERARDTGQISVVDDLRISIATTPLVVDSVIQVSKMTDFGIHHAVHKGVATWYELAKLTMESQQINADIKPISHLELNLPAARPKFSALQPTEFLGIESIDWKEAVNNYLGRN